MYVRHFEYQSPTGFYMAHNVTSAFNNYECHAVLIAETRPVLFCLKAPKVRGSVLLIRLYSAFSWNNTLLQTIVYVGLPAWFQDHL